jgi:spermidine synthase
MIEFTERLPPLAWTQSFTVEEILFRRKTAHQDLVIFRNSEFGRVLALDGVVQTTEGDEFVYHEMLTHVPLFAHHAPRRVLIIGGGDGGILREVLRHPTVEHVTQVEIDAEVIEICKRYLPSLSHGAFDDPRLELVIADGARYVAEAHTHFDVIISDSTDPIGPGVALYTREFYAGCRARLAPGGILVAQNGNVFTQLDEVTTTAARLGPLFQDCTFYGAAVPTYIGAMMALAWATDDPGLRALSRESLEQRYAERSIATRYYTPEMHQGAFALPRFVTDAVTAARVREPA